MSPFLLEAKEIKKSFFYPQTVDVLKKVNLSVRKNESIAIVGPSGSGKSTLLHILGTLETPTSGELYLFGKKKLDLPYIRSQKVGFIFQTNNLLEEYTVLENLLIKAKIARRSTSYHSDAYLEALDLLRRVDLIHRKDFSIKYLSGGEKQRAAIARALMNRPELILADEPTGSLDLTLAKQVQEILIHTCHELNKALVVVTHDPQFANHCMRVLEIHEGVLSNG